MEDEDNNPTYKRESGKLEVDGYRSWSDLCKDLHYYIFSLMSLVSVVCIGSTSRYNYTMYKRHLQDRVNACFISFGLPPAPTLFLMKRLCVVLSGSCALAIIEPGWFKPRDLDLYIPSGHLDAFVEFLLSLGAFQESVDGDRSVPPLSYVGSRASGILRIKYFTNHATGAIINLIETKYSAPSAVFMFHSTFVMNYVSWNTVVCAYPMMTSVGRGYLNTDSDDPPQRTMSCVFKYFLRGFDNVDSISDWDANHACSNSFYCPRALRQVVDGGTMRAVFSSTVDEAEDLVDENVVWRLATTGPCKLGDAVTYEAGFVGNRAMAVTVTDLTNDTDGMAELQI